MECGQEGLKLSSLMEGFTSYQTPNTSAKDLLFGNAGSSSLVFVQLRGRKPRTAMEATVYLN